MLENQSGCQEYRTIKLSEAEKKTDTVGFRDGIRTTDEEERIWHSDRAVFQHFTHSNIDNIMATARAYYISMPFYPHWKKNNRKPIDRLMINRCFFPLLARLSEYSVNIV